MRGPAKGRAVQAGGQTDGQLDRRLDGRLVVGPVRLVPAHVYDWTGLPKCVNVTLFMCVASVTLRFQLRLWHEGFHEVLPGIAKRFLAYVVLRERIYDII